MLTQGPSEAPLLKQSKTEQDVVLGILSQLAPLWADLHTYILTGFCAENQQILENTMVTLLIGAKISALNQ